MGQPVLLLVILATLGAVYAGPLMMSADPDTCAKACTDSSKFGYVAGRTYVYDYSADVQTRVIGGQDDHTTLHLKATLNLEILSKCELSMSVKGAQFTEWDPTDKTMKVIDSAEYVSLLERFPVRLSYQDGHIEELCLTGREQAWVLNIKRGMVSLLQNTMDNFKTNHTTTETDVAGSCPTEYFVRESGWYSTTIGKSKSLLGCKDRQRTGASLQGVPYASDSGIQYLPLLKSDQTCQHKIDLKGSHVSEASCTEQHVFRPFSSGESGATTTATHSLKFQTKNPGTKSPAPITSRVSLTYEQDDKDIVSKQARKDIKRRLQDICDKTEAGVQQDTPRLFTDLVYAMKKAEQSDLMAIYTVLKEGKFCPQNDYRTSKYFLDALPVVGSSNSVQMMTQLMTSGEVSGTEVDAWLTSLAFIRHPTTDTLAAAKPLINIAGHEERALLSVGTLVHTYCQNHGNCERDNTVNAIVKTFTNKMAKACKVTTDNMQATLMALRGLGNAGYIWSAVSDVQKCAEIPNNPTELRLSAIQALRRLPCDDKRTWLLKLLLKEEEDSEIRIAAYQAAMKCPSKDVLNMVRKVLATENSNQVGSYIWSHLTNLMETSDPHKQDLRALLEDETLKTQFDLDGRKFSRNYEASMFLDAVNMGGKMEGDLVWSQKSFMPRSAAVNLTVDMFGMSVNLFEVGARAEGLEYLLETFFGPGGYFSKQQPKSKNEAGEPSIPNVNMQKLAGLDRKMGSTMSELSGSMYMRMFGNEMNYKNFNGLQSLLPGENINMIEMLFKLAENNDYTYTASSMFLDTTFTVPLATGLPLTVSVNGTSTVDLRMKGKLDIRNMDIDGLIQPSGSVSVSVMMGVDALSMQSGVKVISTLHTSTAAQGKLSIDKSGAFNAQYNIPQTKQEIIDVRTSVYTVHRDVEREHMPAPRAIVKSHSCSPANLVTVTGLELCAEMSYPTMTGTGPYMPLTGPITAGVYLYKRDTHTTYHMSAVSLSNAYKNQIHVLFNTPDSKIDRHVELDFDLRKKDNSLRVNLVSPWKTAAIEGDMTLLKKRSSLTGKVTIDGRDPYTFEANMITSINGKTYVVTPTLKVHAGPTQDYSLGGKLTYETEKHMAVDMTAEGFTKEPISTMLSIENKPRMMGVKGSLSLAKDKQYSIETNVLIQSYKKKTLYTPFISVRVPNAELLAFGGSVTHVFDKKIEVTLTLDKVVTKPVKLKGFVQQFIQRRGKATYRTKFDYRSSPMDLALDAKIMNKAWRTISTDIDFTYVIRKIARNNIKFVSKIINQSTRSLTKGKSNINLTVKRNPEYNLKAIAELDHNKKHSQMDLTLFYGDDFKNEQKRIDLNLEMNRVIKNMSSVTADLKSRFKFPAYDISGQMKADHSHNPGNLTTNIYCKLGKTEPIAAKLVLQDRTNSLMNIYGDLEFSALGNDLAVEHIFEQMPAQHDKYLSTLTTKLNKRRNNLQTTIERKDETVYFTSKVTPAEGKPFTLDSELTVGDFNKGIRLGYEQEARRWAGYLEMSYDSQLSKLTGGLENPNQGVDVTLIGKVLDSLTSMQADVALRNGTEDPQKYGILAWLEPLDGKKYNGSLTVSYPSQTLVLNMHHIRNNKYICHADFQWAPKMKIAADTTFQIDNENFYGTAKVTSPFMTEPVSVDVKHTSDAEEYHTNVEVTFGDKVNIDAVLKKPISLHTLVAVVDVSSSIKEYRTLKLFIDHKLSASLASTIKGNWNKQFMEAIVTAQNTTKGRKTGFTGKIELKSSMRYMKKGTFTISHDNNGYTFNTEASVLRNKKQYKLEHRMTHKPMDNEYQNDGKLKLLTPSSKLETNWNHRHTANSVKSELMADWDRSVVSVRLGGNTENEDLTTYLELQVPLTKGIAVLSHNLVKKNKFLDADITLVSSTDLLGSLKAGYTAEEAHLDVKIPSAEVDTAFKVERGDNKTNAYVIFTLESAPDTKMSLLLSLDGQLYREQVIYSKIHWQSNIPGHEVFLYSYELLNRADDTLDTNIIIQYNLDKTIKLETTMGVDNEVLTSKATLTLPYESVSTITGHVSFNDPRKRPIKGDASLEIVPVLKKTSVSWLWDATRDLHASFQLDIPHPEYPRIAASLTSLNMHKGLRNTSDISLSILCGDELKLEFKHDITSKLEGNMKLLSPYGKLAGSIDADTRKVNVDLSADSFVGYAGQVTLDSEQKTNAKITLSMPARRDIVASFSHEGALTSFSTHLDITHNRKNNFAGDLRFMLTDKVDLTATGSLRTQLISETSEYDTLFYMNGLPAKFSVNGHFANSDFGKTSGELSFDITDKKEGKLTIASPHFKQIDASFDHTNIGYKFIESKADIQYGDKPVIDVNARYSSGESQVLDIGLKSMFSENINLYSRLDGSTDNFVSHNSLSYGEKKGEAEFAMSFGKYFLTQRLNLKATGKENIDFETSHTVDTKQVKSVVELGIGQDKHKIDVLLKKNNQVMEATASVTSPSLVPFDAYIIIRGQSTNFNGDAKVTIGKDVSELNVQFGIKPSIVTSLSVTSPYCKDLSVSFFHGGEFPRLETKAKFHLDGQKDFNINMNLQGQKFILDIATPFANFSEFEAEIGLKENKNQGSKTLNAYYLFMGKKSSLEVFYKNASNKYDGQISVSSHLLPALSMGFQHEGNLQAFKCHFEYSVDSDKSELDFAYSSGSKYEVSAAIKSYLTPQVSVLLQHSGSFKHCDCHGELTIDGEKREADLSLNLLGDIKTSLRFRQPEQDDISAAFTHTGPISNFRCTLDVEFGDKWEADLSFSSVEDVHGKFSFKPPKSMSLPVSASFDFNGHLSNLHSHGEISLGDKKSSGNVDFEVTKNLITGSLSFASPYMKDIKANIRHGGPISNLKSHAEVSVAQEKSVADFTLSAPTIKNVDTTFTIQSPYLEPVVLKYKQNFESILNLRTELESEIQGDNRHAILEVDMDRNKHLSFTLNKPSIIVVADLKKAASGHDGKLECTINNSLYKLYVGTKLSDNEKGFSFGGNTPFAQLSKFSLDLNQKGSLSEFEGNAHVTLNKIWAKTDVKLIAKSNRDIQGVIDITGSRMPDFHAELKEKIMPQSVSVSSEVDIDGEPLYTADVILNLKDKKKMEVEIVAPIRYKPIKFVTTWAGKQSGFMTDAELTLGSDVSTGKFTVNMAGKKEAAVSLITPYFPTVSSTMELSGTMRSFAGASEILIDGEKEGLLSINLSSEKDLSGGFSARIPYTTYQDLNGEFYSGNEGDLNTFIVSLKTGEQSLCDFNAKYNLSKYTGDLSFTSNVIHPVSLKYSVSASKSDVQSAWYLTHQSTAIVDGRIAFTSNKANPIELTVSNAINLPELQNNIQITVDPRNGDYMIDSSHTYSGKSMSLMASLQMKDTIVGSMKISLPDRDEISSRFSHKRRFSTIVSDAEFIWNSTAKFEYDMKLKWKNGYQGSVTLTTPIEGFKTTKVIINHSGSVPNIQSDASVDIFGKSLLANLQLDSEKGELRVNTPFEGYETVGLSFHHEGNLQDFRTGGKLLYTTDRQIEVELDHSRKGITTKSLARFMSPFTNEIVLSSNISGISTDFTSEQKISMGPGNQYTSKVTFNTGNKFIKLTTNCVAVVGGEQFVQVMEFNHNGDLQKFKTEAMVKLQGMVSRMDVLFQQKPVLEGSIALITPFEHYEDLQASFSHTGGQNILTTVDLQYKDKKTINGKFNLFQNGFRRIIMNTELSTPFDTMKLNKITYEFEMNNGDIASKFNVDVMSHVTSGNWQSSLNPPSLDVTVKTPITNMKEISVKSSIQGAPKDILSGKSLQADVKIEINKTPLVDADIRRSGKEIVALTVRSPKPMRFMLVGELPGKSADLHMTLDWNKDRQETSINVAAGYDFTSPYSAHINVIRPNMLYSAEGSITGSTTNGKLQWGRADSQKGGWDISWAQNGGKAKLMLPSRSVEVAGSMQAKRTEGYIMWDADKDIDQKVTMKMQTTQSSMRKITIDMPSLGKNAQIISEVTVNQGRLLFDGRTEIRYSPDLRKTIVLALRLEDKSVAAATNYSLSFEVSQPYTTLGVKMVAHAGRTQSAYSSGFSLDYMRTDRRTQQVYVMANLNKARRTISFEVQSPVKTIVISGSVQTDRRFQMSLLNVYDNKQPLSTVLTLDPAKRSLDFSINYNLADPSAKLQLTAGYVNSTALKAELHHTARGSRVSDVMVTARLNTSHLLHSRVHWRPELIDDLQSYMEDKLDQYRARLSRASFMNDVEEELSGKLEKIEREFSQLIGPDALNRLKTMKSRLVENVKTLQADLQTDRRMSIRRSRRDVSQTEVTQTDNWINDMLMIARKNVSTFFNYIEGGIVEGEEKIVGVVSAWLPDNSSLIQYYARLMLVNIVQESGHEALDLVEEAKEITLAHLRSPFTVYDPANGEIQAEVYLLIPVTSLDTLPSLELDNQVQAAMNSVLDNAPSVPSLAALRQLRSSDKILPPFTGMASIKDGKFVTTFDGVTYPLTSDCTYLLSRDFMHQNFTVVLQNDEDRTVTVTTNGGHSVAINTHGQVMINGQEAESLPTAAGDMAVTRPMSGLVSVEDGEHFTILYNTEREEITLRLNGWYFGRNAGLLGTFDNEPSNDMMTPFKKVINNADRFAKTWQIGSESCK